MGLELILTELQPFEHSHFRQLFAWSLCNQLLLQFSVDHFVTMRTCCGYIEDVHVNFCRRKNNFWQNYGILDLDNFQVRLQFGPFALSPCYFSPLSEIPGSIELLENSLTYEGVLWRKIVGCCRVWSLCNQLLLQFSMDHFETMHTCYGYIEDVLMNFCRQKNNFW